MPSLAVAAVSVVTGVVGLAIWVAGLAALDAGRGGYGRGPVPFLKVPRDNGLLLAGLVLATLGLALFALAVTAFSMGGI